MPSASAMVMAGLTMLRDMRGTAAVLAVLEKVGPALMQHDIWPRRRAGSDPAPVVAELASGDLAAVALCHLRALPIDLGQAHARAAIAASAAYLRETASDTAALDTLAGVTDAVRSAGPSATLSGMMSSAPTSDQVALSLLDLLRGMSPDQAHEHARAAIVGAEAFLVEAHGPDYTSAVVSGLLENATRHIEVWGCQLPARRCGATLSSARSSQDPAMRPAWCLRRHGPRIWVGAPSGACPSWAFPP